MTTTMTSAFPVVSNGTTARQSQRPIASRDGEKQGIWIPMLQSVSKGKDLTEKQLIVLGASPDQQREFLSQLNPEQDNARSRFNQTKRARPPTFSNKYALGYTYHDVLDADQEDVLARMNVYMLSNSSAVFAPLIKPLLNPKTVKNTLVTILLDWSEPWNWAKQLRQWIRMLRRVVLSLDDETKIEMEENMTAWKERRTGPDAQKQSDEQKTGAVPVAPPGEGEWDSELGIPLSIVCIQAEKIETLERENGWEEDHFDFLLQWLRTVLLKHGASLCYTASFDSNDLRTLLHNTLNIQSLLKKDIAKHNVIDRDKILVPPNWDSHGKIRIVRENFDPQDISNKWGVEIEPQPDRILDLKTPETGNDSAVMLYESLLPKPPEDPSASKQAPQITVTVPTLQEFLQEQKVELDKIIAKDEQVATQGGAKSFTASTNDTPDGSRPAMRNRFSEIGQYQINVNGIDVDAEEATRRLREREEERRSSKRELTPTGDKKTKPGEPISTEQYKNFFADLMNKKGSSRGSNPASGMVSPRRESPSSAYRTPDQQ